MTAVDFYKVIHEKGLYTNEAIDEALVDEALQGDDLEAHVISCLELDRLNVFQIFFQGKKYLDEHNQPQPQWQFDIDCAHYKFRNAEITYCIEYLLQLVDKKGFTYA